MGIIDRTVANTRLLATPYTEPRGGKTTALMPTRRRA
ncbi:Uncharacterised protein [Mycobacteroides abscessus subsp. abscessus]|nr:Uncharacterised protein [Mycobacteroides abscessus subsp. abscessus]SKU94595.1 Uncharacterised protein [Mycobacteroides abscessus subsp. abscessus]